VSLFIEKAAIAERLATKFEQQPLTAYKEAIRLGKAAGIYAFEDSSGPVYVGRTRNIGQRLRAHIARSHNSASFALKRTRLIHGLPTTYKASGGRAEIVAHPEYGATFRKQIELIGGFSVRFLTMEDPIDQYLSELAITMRYGLPLEGFDSH
jgi:GIY-YIG catalytic domain